jgi:glycine/D-amino acid oxidase-like deaminating enzyme/nitrite reductase/ring-hydroxylating ferredoxin subunit
VSTPDPAPSYGLRTTTAEQSLWLDGLPDSGYPTLDGDATVDVAVVGGGITGLTTALLLKRRGLDVAVVEADRVGTGVSGNNTAKVTALQSTLYSSIVQRHGETGAADYAAASLAGVAQLAALVEEEGIDCGLQRRPAYTYAYAESEHDAVEREAEVAKRAGLPVVLERESTLDVPFPVYGAVRLDDQLLIHPARYAAGLARAVGRIYEHSRVIKAGDDGVRTAGGQLRADRVVIATHYPILDRGLYFARMEAIRSYCIAATLRDSTMPAGVPPTGMAISAGSPSWSLNSYDGQLIVCGQGHPAGQRGIDASRYDKLESFAREHWDVDAITHRWSAQDPSAYDELPMIGSYLPGSTHLYVAAAYHKWGLSTGTFAAMILADLITGRPNPWADRFTPHRFTPRAVPTLAKMNAKVAADLVGDRLHPDPSGVAGVESLAPGHGTVVRDGLDRIAVYRTGDGVFHAVSARCTHLGCLVRFNQAERSWDCPCHGSRFAPDGEVLEGPATRPLPPRTLPT